MKKTILQYLKHLGLTLLVVIPALIMFGLSQGATANYGTHAHFMDWDNDGPYVFFDNDSTLSVNYVQGNREDGFSVEQSIVPTQNTAQVFCHYPVDSSRFALRLTTTFNVPPSIYDDGQPIFAISDLEGNYLAFRDFLIAHNVIDESLNWTFGKGHLVLVGDFVDRGAYQTQLLWLIYRLEQEAANRGDRVHFIIGNHELKNLHGNFESASEKYFRIASILGRQQSELYDEKSLIGRWMASKNALEVINGHLFVHGGISPDLAKIDLSIDEINSIIRANYRQAYFPNATGEDYRMLLSGRWGPCWYRGYFKEDLSDEEVEAGLNKFAATNVIVGHTLQSKAKKHFSGKVIAIDVKHPSDHEMNWPHGSSEALLMEGELHYRLFDDGTRKLLY